MTASQHDASRVRGLLVDIDGVLMVDGEALPGAREALEALRAAGLPMRFLTNTTTRSRAELAQRLAAIDVTVPAEELITAPVAAARYLGGHVDGGVHPVVAEAVLPDLGELHIDRERPACVLIGDIGEAWDHRLVDRLFQQISDGAELVALHRSRSQQKADGLHVDIGIYVAGLEYVSGREAVVIGKPAPTFFFQALDALGLPPEQVAIVGDDIDADIGGGQHCGCTGILVRTGKYRPDTTERSRVRPHHVIDSIADLPALLGLDA